MSMNENNTEIIHSGRVKFKAGLTSKWATIYCTLCKECLRVYNSPDCINPAYSFNSVDSWISAKRTENSSLFILNATEKSSTSSKIFLFDTESESFLHAWLHAFKSAGWYLAISGERFHHHIRSVDNFSARNIMSYRNPGGSLKGFRSVSAPTFVVNGTPISSSDDISLYRERVRPPLRERKTVLSLFPSNEAGSLGDATDLIKLNEKQPNSVSSQVNEKDTFPRCHDLEKGNISKQSQVNGFDGKKEAEFSDEKMTVNNRKGTFWLGSGPKIVRVNEVEINPLMNRNENVQSSRCEERVNCPNELKNSSAEITLNEELHSTRSRNSINASACYKVTGLPRLDQANIFFDPSPDMKGKLLEAGKRSRKTSCTRRGEHILLSESDETEGCGSKEVTDRSKEDQISKGSNTVGVMIVDNGEQETIDGYTRRTSAAHSEGDVDGDGNVFHSGTSGSYLSYLESGYCSKESLSTNESLENRKSSATIDDEMNNNGNQLEANTEITSDLENHEDGWHKEQESCGNVREEIDQMPSECQNSPKPEGRESIAETGNTYSDSVTMPARLGNRPGLLKLEKRSSMSQLLSQLKDRLPGRKSKGNKQPNRKENNKINDSEMLLWHNGGKWKERWFITCENCLIFFKDSAHCSVDFALDMRSCYLDVPDENHEQGFLSFKLIEKDGRIQQFAAVSEETYQTLITLLSKTSKGLQNTGVNNGLVSEETIEAVDMRLDDAIIPYCESEPLDKDNPVSVKQVDKRESIDSGTDGDISCFEGSDASNAGIDQYAKGYKDKSARRRKAALELQQPAILLNEEADSTATNQEKGPVASIRKSYKTVCASKSSPPSPRSASFSLHRKDKIHDNGTNAKANNYLNVDRVDRRMVKSRYSVPDFRQLKMTSDEECYRRQRRSCMEELLKLKEEHKTNQYHEKSPLASKSINSPMHIPSQKSPIFDENGNHRRVDSFNQILPTSSQSSGFSKSGASPATQYNSTPKGKHQNGNTYRTVDLSQSFNLSSSYTDTVDASEDDFRQQTLLMKRRNSLRLKKQFMNEKVKTLRERVKQISAKSEDPEVTDEERNLAALEERLVDIDEELQRINLKVHEPVTQDFKEEKKKNKQHFLKFRSTHRVATPVGIRKSNELKDSSENPATSPSVSPPMRKLSLSYNFKLFGHSGKRDSESSGLNSNNTSVSSMESFHESQILQNEPMDRITGSYNDVRSTEGRRFETQMSRKASSVSSIQESDETDEQIDTESGLHKDALSKIEDFEQFAVEISAKRVTDYIEV